MIRENFYDYPNGWAFDTRYMLKLSDNEQERLKEILKELQEMFMADGVSFDIPELTLILEEVQMSGNNLAEQLKTSQEEERDRWEAFWKAMGECEGYIDMDCPECGRHRVEHWSCGKDICEKCNWCIQDNEFYNWEHHEYIGEI